jgi:hypothetical protein
MRPNMGANRRANSWVGYGKLGCEIGSTGGVVLLSRRTPSPRKHGKFVASQTDKGMGELLTPWRLWCAAPRIPIGNLGYVLYALLVGVSIFFGEAKLVGMLT